MIVMPSLSRRIAGAVPAAVLLAALLPAAPAAALGPDDFATGPLIDTYGPVAAVPGAAPLPPGTTFHVAFDVADRSTEDALNSTLTGAARFLNMHVGAGVAAEDLHLAIIVHGGAVHDVTRAAAGENADLVEALLSHGVRLIVCGQSAAYQDVTADDLLPGVEMALSAMTAHALLQADGYTLNPF